MSIHEHKTFISAIAPFDRLSSSEIEAVTDAMDIAYYKPGDKLIARRETPSYLYLIVKGIVKELDNNEEMINLYTQEESFDAVTLLQGESKHDFIVAEELIAYILPRELFLDLIKVNVEFGAFYHQNLSKRMDDLVEKRNSKELASFMVAKVKDAYVHPPLTVPSSMSVYDTAQYMTEQKQKFVLIRGKEDIGIITDRDLRDHVVLQRYDIDSPIGNIATFNLIGLQSDDFLFNALMLMTKHGINHLLVWEGDTLKGVMEQIDLLSYLSNHSRLVTVQIARAKDPDQLRKASRNLTNVVRSLYAQGMKIRYIMQLVNELNRQVFKKLYQFVAPPEVVENTCLLVMGSEGRGEQIIKTDQDNAIIIRDGFEYPGMDELVQKFSQALEDFGYPPCPGKIMVNNPYWCKHLEDYKTEMRDWIHRPSEEKLMNLAIFFDANPVAGDPELLKEARSYLFNRLQDDAAFHTHFARPTLAFETPIGMFANFVFDKSKAKDGLDIKKGGIFAIVQGVRSLALEYKITHTTNTISRIKELRAKGVLEREFSIELIEAFAFMSGLRLQADLDKLEIHPDKPVCDNYIKPATLNKMERDLLKDSFKIVNDFKKVVTYHFKLNVS